MTSLSRAQPERRLPPAILLMGPTASGKTELACELAQAYGCEIVSVDSALVYRHMDVGTAKPDKDTLARAPHHLIDLIEPTERYSAAQFREDALRVMGEITARGRIPLLVGGTLLYFRALTQGLSELPPADPVLREAIERRAKALGWAALHAELARLDPKTARCLKPNDAQRIQRALEVCHLSGQPMSAALENKPQATFPYSRIELALAPTDRSLLHRRIAERFEAMLDAGLVEELAALRQRFSLTPELPAMRCVGYRQAWQYLEGEYGYAMLREKGIAATRQLAKRQLTWLRGLTQPVCFDCFSPELARKVGAHLADWQGRR
ncbi:MAG: tRNA (adenosine(37)-N6)-dimethylallyltransferase MiaA [Betaproteobacteria bacterium]|nr:tRNA (adenosine(37)-N6)-dimethylallyltransferase MiaA [Betaproteobacteria bacterium]